MDKFIITPEDCLILKAINETKSLREAAMALDCDPAGLARKVQQISSQYGFVQKVNNRWQVNSKGRDLIIWAEDSIREQKKILTARNSLTIASTMWFAEELLISKLPRLKDILQKDTNLNLTVPNAGFEESLVNGSADFVIVCHPPENPEIEHRQITEEKWCLVMPASWNEKNILEKLKSKPFIRHTGINQDLFLPEFADGILNSGYTFDNLIGVKSAVVAGLGWSIVPKILVQRDIENKKLKEIPYELSMKDRKVCVWWLRNRIEMKKKSAKVCQWVKESAE